MTRYIVSAFLLCSAGVFWGACTQCEPGEVEEPQVTLQVPKFFNPFSVVEEKETTFQSILELPVEVPFLLVGKDVSSLQTMLDTIAEETRVEPDVSDTDGDGAKDPELLNIRAFLQKGWGTPDTSWIDATKPVFIFQYRGSGDDSAWVLMLPTIGVDKVIEELSAGERAGKAILADRHTLGIKAREGEDIDYFDTIGTYVIVTGVDDAFEKVAPFIKDSLLAYEPTSTGEIVLKSKGVAQAFAADVANARSKPKDSWSLIAEMMAVPTQPLLFFVDEAERASIELDVGAGSDGLKTLVLTARVLLKQESTFVGWTNLLEGRAALTPANIPENTWLVQTFNLELQGSPLKGVLAELINETYSSLCELSEAEKKASSDLWNNVLGLLTGTGFIAIAKAEQEGVRFPISTVLVVETPDAHRVRALYESLLFVVGVRLIPRIQDGEVALPEIVPPLPQDDYENFDDLLRKYNERYQGLGLRAEAIRAVQATSGVATDGLVFYINPPKWEAPPGPAQARPTLATMFGTKMGIAIAFRGQLVSIAIGNEAIEMAVDGASGSLSGKELTWKGDDSGYVAITHVELGRFAKVFKPGDPNNTNTQDPLADTGLTMDSKGLLKVKGGAGRLEGRLIVPLTILKGVVPGLGLKVKWSKP